MAQCDTLWRLDRGGDLRQLEVRQTSGSGSGGRPVRRLTGLSYTDDDDDNDDDNDNESDSITTVILFCINYRYIYEI